MNEISQILSEATAAIACGYFHLNIDGGDPVYRERVYCYELYHQMRLRWPSGCQFSLNGEVDKISHPILRNLRADHSKPDFLVHRPGDMKGNHAIIEVKKAEATNKGICKDLRTLDQFIQTVHYQRAIYLLFGYEADRCLVDRVQSIVRRRFQQIAPIEVWLHQQIGQPAMHSSTLVCDARLGQPDGISPSRMAEMLEVDKAGPKVRC
jgi:hypothetical protein